jgi:3-oxoacyl-[acyl-carrier protein] reductase
VSVLINNAGITADNLMIRMSDDEWNDVIETNLSSIFRITKEIVRDMMKQRYGRIINIGSVVGLSGNAGQVNYSSSKSALLGFSKSLAREVASRNITVNIISPGFIDTDMTKKLKEEQKSALISSIPLGRMGSAAELANVVKFIASEEASYITGENINVNGGLYM